jgi:hypothetical protein
MRYVTVSTGYPQQLHRCFECISRVTADSLLSTNFSGTNYASLSQDQQAKVRAAVERKGGGGAPPARKEALPFLTRSRSGKGGACKICRIRVPEGTLRYVVEDMGGQQHHHCLKCIGQDRFIPQDQQAQVRAAVERRVGRKGAQEAAAAGGGAAAAFRAIPQAAAAFRAVPQAAAAFRTVPSPPAPPAPPAPPTLASRLDEIYSWAGAARPTGGLPLGERIARLEDELGLPREEGASVAGRVGRLRREVGLEE